MVQPKDPAKPKHAGGRPKIPFDGSDSDKVRLLKMAGTLQTVIAAILGCNEKTLRNRFPEELKTEPLHAYAVIDATLIGMCLAGNLEAIKWLDVSRRNLKPTSRTELTGADGGPVEFKNMTDEEVDARIADILGSGDAGEVATPETTGPSAAPRGARRKG